MGRQHTRRTFAKMMALASTWPTAVAMKVASAERYTAAGGRLKPYVTSTPRSSRRAYTHVTWLTPPLRPRTLHSTRGAVLCADGVL